MNILILADINPINIVTEYNNIANKFGECANVYSPQMLALYGEELAAIGAENYKHLPAEYDALNILFCWMIKDNDKLNKNIVGKDGKKPLILFGNCLHDSYKFDEIVTADNLWINDNKVDSYLRKCCDRYSEASKVKFEDFYTYDEAAYKFPDSYHLSLYLQTLLTKGGWMNNVANKT